MFTASKSTRLRKPISKASRTKFRSIPHLICVLDACRMTRTLVARHLSRTAATIDLRGFHPVLQYAVLRIDPECSRPSRHCFAAREINEVVEMLQYVELNGTPRADTATDLGVNIVPPPTNATMQKPFERREILVQLLLVLASRKMSKPTHAPHRDSPLRISLSRMSHDTRWM
jgi:hypothetical protein